MLQHEFIIRLSTVICNDKQLFELTTYFVRTLIAYIKTNDCLAHLSMIATILTNYLNTFTTHNALAPYQLPYVNRLVGEVLKICDTYVEILSIWLKEIIAKPTTDQGRHHHPVSLLPLQQIIENFLMNDFDTFKTANWEDFIKLSQKSAELTAYLCSQRTGVFDDMMNLYFFPSEEYLLLHVSVLEPVLSAVIKVMEDSSQKLGTHYFGKFINMLKKHLSLSVYNDDSIIFILQLLLNLGAVRTLGRLVDDFSFQLYLNDKFQDHRILEKVLYVLSDVLHRYDQCFLKLLSTKDDTQLSSPHSTFLDQIRIKVMRIHGSNAQPVSHRFITLLIDNSASLENYNLDTQSALVSQVFQLLLQYFQNKPSLDAALNQLSLMIFLKFNMLNSATFLEVIHYLIACYEVYHLHLKLFELYQYDTVELLKIMAQLVTPPNCEILAHYGIVCQAQCINYVTLPMQLDLCRQLITDFYICCKLKADT